MEDVIGKSDDFAEEFVVGSVTQFQVYLVRTTTELRCGNLTIRMPKLFADW